ncbi:putative leader peptide [Streptomyces malaysiensis]|uniref:putative leader peptide n=1 Tax=Streptomyces malaysiensis TaxID=92644 RepID=UPI0038503B23
MCSWLHPDTPPRKTPATKVRGARHRWPVPDVLASFVSMYTSALLTTRGHIDLLRVASAACPGHR